MKVKELLSDEYKWTKHAFAKDVNDKILYEDDNRTERAVKWCLSGAIDKCYPHDCIMSNPIYLKVSKYIKEKFGIHHDVIVSRWNDEEGRSFEDVRRVVEELDI